MTALAKKNPGDRVDPVVEKVVCRDWSARRLLTAIAGGDESSMAVFYRRYEQEVYGFACSRLDDPQSAADVVNEVMLGVWRGAHDFKGESKVRTWLLGIANNKVRDVLRRRSKWRHQTLDPETPDVSAPECESIVADSEYRQCVKQCLRALTDQHRQIVYLAFFEDLSYPQIADITGCPVGTVKTRMYHAKIALKRGLERMGVDHERLQPRMARDSAPARRVRG